MDDDDRYSDSSDDSNDGGNPQTVIVSGLFGIDNEEKAEIADNDPNSKCSDDIVMEEVDHDKKNYGKIIHKESDNSKKPDDMNSVTLEEGDIKKEDESIAITEKSSFGNHILCPNSTNPDSQLPSFAVISQNYEKSRQDIESNKLVTSTETNNVPVSELDSESTVVAEPNLPSTLSLISANYQESSSDDSCNEANESNSDLESSIVSSTFVKEDDWVKTKGELDISDLPPIEDLKISVDEEKCQPVGCIKSIVDTLVVVEAFLNQPALDIDSVLFVDRGQRALGRVFDVFGSVNKPFYAVRFNNSDHIKKFDIKIKESVYCAPQTEYASFVMVSQLLKMKGSDASWRHNNEPPCELLDYSDDEEEKAAKKLRKQKKLDAKLLRNNAENNTEYSHTQKANKRPTVSREVENTNQRSSAYNSNRAQPYGPRSSNPPCYNNQGPRYFPTYAQQLSSMDYNYAYRQPYNPWYYDPSYAPRHSYPYPPPPPPPPPFMPPPGFDYRSQRPPNSSNSSNQYPYPYPNNTFM